MKIIFQILLGVFICIDQVYAEQLEIVPSPNLQTGFRVFNERCVLWHGEKIKVLKDPPPADLTKSIVPDEYLQLIIAEGGEAVGRSIYMPPWKDELSNEDIRSVIFYIKTFQKNAVLNETVY